MEWVPCTERIPRNLMNGWQPGLGKFIQKRFYNRETIPIIRISPFGWKALHFIIFGWDHLIKKGVNYLSCMEGKVEWYERHLVYFIIRRGNCFSIINLFCSYSIIMYYFLVKSMFFQILQKNSENSKPRLNSFLIQGTQPKKSEEPFSQLVKSL